ncbi:MAG: MATE family efflux transporter [Myxococcota bacterium]
MSIPVQVDAHAVPRRAAGGVFEISNLAYPVVLQTLAETFMQVIDSAMVGRLGATELGAIGFGGVWMWTLFVAFVGAAQGVQVFVSRHHGAGEPRSCGRWVWQAIWILLPAMTLWCVVIAFGFPQLIRWIGTSPELAAKATEYTSARVLQGPALVIGFAIVSFFRGIGDTRTPLIAGLTAIGVNVVSAYGLIFGAFGLPAWGIYGAGVAMTLSTWVNAALMVLLFARRRIRTRYVTRPVRPEPADLRRFGRTGLPIGGQWLLEMLSFAIFSSIVARMGDISMAASQAMLQLLSLSFMQAVAISIATATLVGRYLGAGDVASAERSYRSALKLAFVPSAAIAALFLSVPEALLRIFSDDPQVLALGRPLLALGAFFQLLDATSIVAGGALRGAGDTRWSFATSVVAAWGVRLPLLWLIAIHLDGGVMGAWIAELFLVGSLAGAFVLRFRGGRWKTLTL